MQRGTFQLMKSLNRTIILNKVRLEGPISRAQIAKDTSLTPPTVSSIVKELISDGLIMESEQGASKGGRKPTMLIINSNSFYVIGVDAGPTDITTVLTNLEGHILTSFKRVLPFPLTNDDLLAMMIEEIQKVFVQEDKLIGIGVGMHGVVDSHNGRALYAPNLNIRDVNIKDVLEATFGLTVMVENDAKALALGEVWFGEANRLSHIAAVNVGNGIGAGMIANGKIVQGHHFIAGEIGHMTIDIGGKPCSCGNYGCLQTLAAGPAIAERAQKEIAIGRESVLKEMMDGDLQGIDGQLVYEAAKQGDELSIHVLQTTGNYLGIGLTNLIHILNPEHIIIGGGVANAGDFLLNAVRETVAKMALTEQAKQTTITLSTLGEKGTVLGAVALVLQDLFE
ncbi:ROK family protein [Fictibacillus macauensis ZFHKF-1]|uniref:ROK family protein n=1 Tax=Fictibacillus macauensis ZFHKF-1 TaxID=1196324 RepID=I8UAQ8_9BACL|nr:ROK family transcriptional regulator [Fictibacillus macauensis]EIT83893.1 ROK family protein [Fictibacillus macauensis ZFHKF-1]